MAEIKTQTLDSYLRVIEISRDLASTLDLDILLDDIVRAAADITAPRLPPFCCMTTQRVSSTFRLPQISTSLPCVDSLSRSIKAFAGWIVTNRKSVRIDDAQKDDRHL